MKQEDLINEILFSATSK